MIRVALLSPSLVNVWAPLPPDAWLWPRATQLPFPLDRPEFRLFAFARQALWHGLGALGLEPDDELIVPDYSHGSEIEALERAGLKARFYRCDDRLEPIEEELEPLIGPRTRGLYLIHYNGFPQDSARWRSWCDQRELLMIEDGAQAWLSSRDGAPVGSLADLAFFCAYKTYGLPEGALLIGREPPTPLYKDPGRGLGAVARRHGVWLAQRSAAFTSLAERVLPTAEYAPTLDFELGDLQSLPWSTTAPLLYRLVSQDAAAARRSNYRVMLRELADAVPEPFDELPEGASPFFFPVRCQRKQALLDHLADRGIKALNVWSATHPSVSPVERSDALVRRATTVGLPVHQELGAAHLERVIDAVAKQPAPRRGLGRSRLSHPQLRADPIEDVDAIAAEWDSLAERSGNLFATREWVSTWWRHYGADGEWAATALRDPAGQLVAILPFYVASARPVRVLRFLGHGAGDWLGPICAPQDIERVALALGRLMHTARPRWQVLLGEQSPADQRWAALLGATRLRFEASPSLHVEWASFDDFLASRSRNFREQVRRKERKLSREHDLRYRLCGDPRELAGDLDTLFDLHDARWQDASDAFDAQRRRFHHDFASLALQRGWLRLWGMDLDGRRVAAWYGFRFAGAEWYYQGGRDPAYERQAVGFVLLSHTVREAMGDGVGEYKLLRGGEEYKGRFANRDTGLETFVVGRGPVGAVSAAALGAAGAMPSGARRRLQALAG